MKESKESKIPKGPYCYDDRGLCPFWEKRKDKPYQEDGYCHYLNFGDWESETFSLLWDQVKECGINDDFEFWEDMNS